jgi:L-2-hydroxyglutarate oxidase
MIARRRFRALVRNEVLKSLFLSRIWREARLLIPELEPRDLMRSYAGNRAQLVSRTGELVDDIVLRESERTVHVLNAVSPGLTCSLPFGAYLAQLCIQKSRAST